MPKRKRGGENNPVQLRKEEVEQKLEDCRKLLNKALKLARGFERQKLGRRVKTSTQKSDQDDLKRLNKEIEILKTLDLSRTVDAHLHKSLLKSKSISESPLLPSNIHEIQKPSGKGEEDILAFNNVTARMYNTKPVKDAMSQIMTMMYIALEIPEPSQRAKGKKAAAKQVSKTPVKDDVSTGHAEDTGDEEDRNENTVEMDIDSENKVSWDGFDSGLEEEGSDDSASEDEDNDFSFDEEQLSRYDARLGNSSDDDSDSGSLENDDRESSFPPPTIPAQNSSKPTKLLSISRSPSPITTRPKSILKAPKVKPELEAPKGSVFLPTLMGGYWSGTESEASDNESILAGPMPRKNRRGQRARRQIAEAKFGNRAKHLAAENAGKPSRNGRDDREKDWDMKRGAIPSGDGAPMNRKQRRMAGVQVGRAGRDITGENAIPLGKNRSAGEKVQVKVTKGDGKKGVNHPSWQAAKKAKEAVQMASFQGTKFKFS